MGGASRPVKVARTVGVTALYVAFSLYLTSTFVAKHRQFNAYTPAQMQQLLRGEAKRPFSLRVLLPWTVAAVVAPIDRETRRDWSRTVFRDHPGVAVVAKKHLHTGPELFVEMVVVVGPRDVTPWSFVDQAAAVLIIVLVFRRFAAKPLLLRRASVMALPLFAAYLYGGYWPEPRVFYEVTPVFGLLAYENLFALLDKPLSHRERSPPEPLLRGGLAPYTWPMVAVGSAVLLLIAVMAALAAKATAQ